jgi:NDP-sugar pyrophosphorylase family protein
MTQLNSKGELVSCYREECDWLDIGRVDDYKLAVDLFEKNKSHFIKDYIK